MSLRDRMLELEDMRARMDGEGSGLIGGRKRRKPAKPRKASGAKSSHGMKVKKYMAMHPYVTLASASKAVSRKKMRGCGYIDEDEEYSGYGLLGGANNYEADYIPFEGGKRRPRRPRRPKCYCGGGLVGGDIMDDLYYSMYGDIEGGKKTRTTKKQSSTQSRRKKVLEILANQTDDDVLKNYLLTYPKVSDLPTNLRKDYVKIFERIYPAYLDPSGQLQRPTNIKDLENLYRYKESKGIREKRRRDEIIQSSFPGLSEKKLAKFKELTELLGTEKATEREQRTPIVPEIERNPGFFFQ